MNMITPTEKQDTTPEPAAQNSTHHYITFEGRRYICTDTAAWMKSPDTETYIKAAGLKPIAEEPSSISTARDETCRPQQQKPKVRTAETGTSSEKAGAPNTNTPVIVNFNGFQYECPDFEGWLKRPNKMKRWIREGLKPIRTNIDNGSKPDVLAL